MDCIVHASSQGLLCTGPVSVVGERRHKVVSSGSGVGAAERGYHLVQEGRCRVRPAETLFSELEFCALRILAYYLSLILEIAQKFNRKLLPMATTAVQDDQSSSPAHRSAQFLSEQGFMEIPTAFVRAPEERSNLHESVAEGTPVIDLATATPAEIGEACFEWGFFQV